MRILHYMRRKGNESFEALPFNEIDCAILAWASYLDFPSLYEEKENSFELGKTTFSELSGKDGKYIRKMIEKVLPDKENFPFANAFISSKRYQGVKLIDYRIVNSDEKNIQYGVFLFEVTPELYVLSYRGTNLSLYGWEEDCNILLGEIPSDRLAAEDLERMSKEIPEDASFIVTGHSKGGHLAVYAPLLVSPDVRRKIRGIYNFDGPGASVSIENHPAFEQIRDKIHKYVPENDIIGGMLDDYKGNVAVVNAQAGNGIFQHQVLTWYVRGDRFLRQKQLSRRSLIFEKTFDEWVFSLREKERRNIIQGLWEFLNECGFKEITDFGTDFFSAMRSVALIWSKSEKEERRAFFNAAQVLVSRFIGNSFSYRREKPQKA